MEAVSLIAEYIQRRQRVLGVQSFILHFLIQGPGSMEGEQSHGGAISVAVPEIKPWT